MTPCYMLGIYEHPDCNLLSYDAVFSSRELWTEFLVFYILTMRKLFFRCFERMCCLSLHHPHINNSVTLKMGTARWSKTSEQTFITHALRTQNPEEACKLMLLQNWRRRKCLLPPAAEYISTPVLYPLRTRWGAYLRCCSQGGRSS